VRVLGADGCRRGWLGVVWSGDRCDALFAPTIAGLAEAAGPVAGVGVDIPIGLVERGQRTADTAARAWLGPFGRSVFLIPPAPALRAEPFRAALAESARLGGAGFSQQAYALRGKIFEVEAWLPVSPAPVWEVHPEVSFSVASGSRLRFSKRTWAGVEERRAILARQGMALGGPMLPGGAKAGPDDVLDAAIAAWSARRLVSGAGESFPRPPGQFSGGGRPIAIWA
jgi:predicted RNase H-like nuclease